MVNIANYMIISIKFILFFMSPGHKSGFENIYL